MLDKKIIFFDSWTAGISNFVPIDKELKKRNINTFLLHMESKIGKYLPKNVDKNILAKNNNCSIENISCVDMSFYKKSLFSILKEEKPALVIMISLTHPENRVVTVACQRLNIPVFYLMHGVMSSSKEENDKKINQSINSTKYKILYKLSKLPKFYDLFKEYYNASGDIVDTFSLVSEFIKNPYRFMWSPKFHKSLQVNKALLYSKTDLELFQKVFNVEKERLFLVGNPKLDKMLDFVSQGKDKFNLPSKYIVYIDQALVEGNFISEEENSSLLEKLSKLADNFNLELIVKLHPRANSNKFKNKNKKIKFVSKEIPLEELLFYSEFILGHFSTVLIESLALRKPTLSLLFFKDIRNVKLFSDNYFGNVYNEKELKKAIQRILDNRWEQEELRNNYFPNDVLAIKNIIREIEEVI